MNAFQTFLSNNPFGFIKDTDLPELIKLNRLCQVLVRLTRGGRFVCAAQDAAGLIAMVEQCGDFVRDVSVTSAELERAAQWQPEASYVDAWTRCARASHLGASAAPTLTNRTAVACLTTLA